RLGRRKVETNFIGPPVLRFFPTEPAPTQIYTLSLHGRSSDLPDACRTGRQHAAGIGQRAVDEYRAARTADRPQRAGCEVVAQMRSEERRVGKECRSRWWQYH